MHPSFVSAGFKRRTNAVIRSVPMLSSMGSSEKESSIESELTKHFNYSKKGCRIYAPECAERKKQTAVTPKIYYARPGS